MVSKLTAFAALAVWLLPCGRVAIAQAPTGWSSFRSPDYGFTIAYPPTMKLYDHPRGEDPGGYAAICQATVACFGYPGDEFKGTTFDGAGIAINILRDAKTEQQCSTLGSAEYPQPTTRTETIHGTLFHVGEIGEGGMNHSQAITAYRTMRRNVCGTFEYPADATLRLTAQNFFDRPGSDRITCSITFPYRGRDYTLAVKEMVGDPTRTNAWLKKSGYPPLENTNVSGVSQVFTDQQAGPYHYVYCPGEIFIFSVADTDGHIS